MAAAPYLRRDRAPAEVFVRRAGAAPGARAAGSAGIVAWLERACRPSRLTLQPDVHLAPLVASLPPPDMRLPLSFRRLDGGALRGFDLKPVIKGVGPPARAQPAADVKPEFRVWQLAHSVHDVFTDQWPATWARPAFPRDKADPQESEWINYAARMLSAGKTCKATLDGWAKLPSTAPHIRATIVELVKCLKRVYVQNKKVSDAAKEVEARELAQRSAASEGSQRQARLEHEMSQLQATYEKKTSKLLAENEHLAKAKDEAKKTLRIQNLARLTQLQTQYALDQSRLQQEAARAAAPSESGAAVAGAAPQPPAEQPSASPSQPPPAKRPRP